MRRAIPLLLLAAALAALAAAPSRVLAGPVKTINGVGLIDFSRKPDFKVGQWARYHVTGSSATGFTDDYTVTVSIAGEERFWGEEGFWVETLTEPKDRPPSLIATLLSYDVFKDPQAIQNMQFYIRKTITELDDHNRPVQQIMKRQEESLRQRGAHNINLLFHRDSLGTDTLTVPAGHYQAQVFRIRQGSSTSVDARDSTQYTEMRENRTTYMSAQVPVTGIVREDIDYTLKQKTWLIGRSSSGEFVTLEHSTGRADLIGFGEGHESNLLTPAMQTSLEQQDRAAAAAANAAKRPRPARKAPAGR